MYGDIVNSFKDKLIGTAVDNVVDTSVNNLKDKNTLANTYVWTCINKETHNGNVANLTFINKLGKRQRVPYDRLAQFCQMNYVSNVIVEDGKVKMQGCSLYDLPNFKLNAYGQYDLSAPHDENWVYQMAIPYIQSQERLIQEDFANGCLKTSRGNGIQTNASANISAVAGGIKDVRGTAEAVAITAVTAAGAAAVTGTVVAGKAIFNQLNKKKLIEEQDKICIMLGKASDFVKALTMAKYKTNAMYRNDSNLVTYSNEVEANNETTGKLANELRAYGMSGCIQKMQGVLNSAKSRATSAKILDMKLSGKYAGYGTIGTYIQNIENSLIELERLHNETNNLINNNIAIGESNKLKLLEQEQQSDLVRKIEYNVNQILIAFNTLKVEDINSDNVDKIEEDFNNYNIIQRIANVYSMMEDVKSVEDKIRLRTPLDSIRIEVNKFDQEIKSKKESRGTANITNGIMKAAYAETEISTLLLVFAGSEETQRRLDKYNEHISEAKKCLNNIKDEKNKKELSEAIKHAESYYSKNRLEINSRARNADKEEAEFNKFKSIIERRRNEIHAAKNGDSIQRIIDLFESDINRTLTYVKFKGFTDEINRDVAEVREEFKVLKENKESEDNASNLRKIKEINRVEYEIRTKKTWLENYNPDIITEETLEEIKIPSLLDYKHGIEMPKSTDFAYSYYKDMTRRYDELSSLYSEKKNKFRTIYDRDKSAIANFKRVINGLHDKIGRLKKEYEKEYIESGINNLKTSVDREKLQSTDWLDAEIEVLSQEYRRKCVDLCI